MKFAAVLLTSLSFASFGLAQSSLPLLRLSTAAVGPVNVAQGGNPAAQVIQIYNGGSGTITPTVTSGASWLLPSVGVSSPCKAPLTGTCIPLTITFNTASLAVGTYTGFLSVTDPNAVDAPQTISVTVNVVGYGAPSGVTLYAAPNGGSATTTVNTHGVVTAQASTATGGSWLTVSLSGSGSFSFYYPYQIKATSQTGQAVGSYSGSVKISGSNTASDNTTIPVTFNVTDQPIAQVNPTAVTLFAGTGATVSQTVSVGNAGEGSLSVSGATPTTTSGGSWLSATVSGSSITVTANAGSLAPGGYSGSISLASNAANNAAVTIPVSLFVTSQTGPQIGFGGVVDNTGQAPLAPGTIAVAYGTEFLSGSPAPATALPLATTLAGVQVLVNGTAAPLYYASSGQIDFQLPYETASGTAVVQVVNNGILGNKVSVQVVARAPRILITGGYGSPPIIVDYTTGAILGPGIFAHAGDALVIYAIGLGQTNPAAVTGAAANGAPNLQQIPAPNSITLAGSNPFDQITTTTPSYVGLAPGFAGLYQINFVLPANYVVPSDHVVSLTMKVNGATSIPVQFSVD